MTVRQDQNMQQLIGNNDITVIWWLLLIISCSKIPWYVFSIKLDYILIFV